MVYYGITDDTRKNTEKKEFKESLTSAQSMKLHHECDCQIKRTSENSTIFTPSHLLIRMKTKQLIVLESSLNNYRFASFPVFFNFFSFISYISILPFILAFFFFFF